MHYFLSLGTLFQVGLQLTEIWTPFALSVQVGVAFYPPSPQILNVQL